MLKFCFFAGVCNTRFLTDQVAVKTMSTLNSVLSNGRKSADSLLFVMDFLWGTERRRISLRGRSKTSSCSFEVR